MRSSSSAASYCTCCPLGWCASASSASSPIVSANPNWNCAALCSVVRFPAAHPDCGSGESAENPQPCPICKLGRLLVTRIHASGNRSRFQILHDRIARPDHRRTSRPPMRDSADLCPLNASVNRYRQSHRIGSEVLYPGDVPAPLPLSAIPNAAITGKARFKPHRLHPAQFNEFIGSAHAVYPAPRECSPVSTPDRILSLSASEVLRSSRTGR